MRSGSTRAPARLFIRAISVLASRVQAATQISQPDRDARSIKLASPPRISANLSLSRPERFDPRQRFAFHPFEEGSAGRRDMGEIAGAFGLVERGDRVPAPG